MDRTSILRTVLAVLISFAILFGWRLISEHYWPPPKRTEEPARRKVVEPEEPEREVEQVAEKPAPTKPTPEKPPTPTPPKPAPKVTDLTPLVPAYYEPSSPVMLGSAAKGGPYDIEVVIQSTDAAVRSLTLSKYFKTAKDRDKEDRDREKLMLIQRTGNLRPLAISEVEVWDATAEAKSVKADLTGTTWQYVESESGRGKAVFRIVLLREQKPYLEITKIFTVEPRKKSSAGEDERVEDGKYELRLQLVFRDIAGQIGHLQYTIKGPAGMPREGVRSDLRQTVVAVWDNDVIKTTPIAGSKVKDKQKAIVEQWEEDEGQRWSGPFPPADLATDNIAWVASDNKYFAVVLVPLPAKSGKRQKHVTAIVADTYTDVTPMGKTPVGQSHLISQKISFPKGVAEVRRSFLLFAGPKEEELLEKQYADYNFPALIVWARSCCFCAIPGIHYISKFMVWAINSFTLVTFNYGLSIILLVIIIRVVMHPITRWTQKSARKMQKLAPLMQELKERCGDDKKRLQQEQMLLYKEHGVNPMGMILPMFVQMPIWFGLYGGLMVAISLRQAPFFWWIQDLSQPDALITFSQPFFLPGADIPLLGYLVNMINGMLGGGITSLNILPLFVVIGMYLQQLVMPRTTTGPQAAQQKHMMIFMTIFLGLVLYSAPAGLNLYICTSTTLGFIEQRLIRRHLNRLDSEPSTAPPPGPPPGKKQDLGSGRYRSPAERIEAWLAKRVGAKKAAPKPPGEKKKRKK